MEIRTSGGKARQYFADRTGGRTFVETIPIADLDKANETIEELRRKLRVSEKEKADSDAEIRRYRRQLNKHVETTLEEAIVEFEKYYQGRDPKTAQSVLSTFKGIESICAQE